MRPSVGRRYTVLNDDEATRPLHSFSSAMLCSIPTPRIRRNPQFPAFHFIVYFSNAIFPQDFTGESSHSKFEFKALKFAFCLPLHVPRSINLNQARTLSCPARNHCKITNLEETWARKKMQECARAGNLLEAHYYLKLLNPTILDYNALFDCYLKHGCISFDQLVQVYIGIRRFGHLPNVWTFNILFNGLCTLGFLQDSFLVIEEMCRNNFVPSCTILKRLMKKSLRSGFFNLTHRVLGLMFRYGYKPTLPSVNSLIHAFCIGGKVCEANSLFWILIEKRFAVNVYSYNPILSSLCKSGQILTAMAFLCSLIKRGFVLNVYSYTSLILGFSNEGLWDDAYFILELMHINGCVPTVVTYTVLINSLCKYSYVEDAIRIYEVMDKKGCSPDQITYNVLLHGLCIQNRTFDAIKLAEDMSGKGFHPDQFTCCTLASCMLKAGLVRKSQELIHKVLLTSNSADVAVWNVYLHSLCYDNQALEASALLRHKMGEGFVPTNVTWNTILKGFCMEKKFDEALMLLDQSEWCREGPDVISFNTIFSAACDEGYSSMIRRIFYRMEVERIEANIITLTCLLRYFGKIGNLSKVNGLLRYMINSGFNPTAVTYNVVLDILCKRKLLVIACQMFIKFKGSGTFPDTTSYNILIQAAAGKSCYPSVRCLLANMYRWGLLPDGVTFVLLSSVIGKMKNIPSAFHLEYIMLEHGVRPNISFYNNIMYAMFQEGKLGDIYCLLHKMLIVGIELNDASCKILNCALSNGGRKRYSKAMMILKNILRNVYNVYHQ